MLPALLLAPLARAAFVDGGSASHTVSTAALAAPTNPATAAGSCVVLVGDEIVVSWTRTSSTWADGYEVLRATALAGPYVVVGTVAGQTTESFTDGPLLPLTTYYYMVRATKGNWRSASTASVSRTTRTSLCL